MAFLWSSANSSTQFDQLVEQSTSDLLPAKSPLDLDAALRLADSVRSASVPPSEAALKLVTRLGHDNPNVQLLTLQLADVLVKNAGNQFLKAFASNGAGGAVNELDYLCSGTSTTRGGRPPVVNRDVQLAARQKLQEWASAFEASGRPLLSQSDLVKLYHRLRSTPNVPFPAPVDATTTAAMVDSLSAPDWSDSPYCTRCRTEFSTFNRKHHCRNCGNVFDQQCSSQSMPLPHYGITTESVRVCDACAKQIKLGKGAQVARTILEQQANSSSGAKTTMTTTRRRDEEQEDADLQRAIQASLAESTSATSASHGPVRHSPPPPAESGYHPSYASQIQSSSSEFKKEGGATEEGEEEDPDLAAAIAASLKDLESSRPRASAPAPAPAPAQTYSDLFPSSSSDHRAPTATTSATKTATGAGTAFHLPSYDLTPVEQSHLSQFLSLSSQLDPAYPTSNDESSYRLVSEVLQPKLERSLRDARTRGEILREMEAKLSEAARLYGAGLTERVVGRQEPQAYRSPSYSNPSAYPTPLTPYQDPSTTRYHYAPPTAGYGQPLPAYAVPAVVVPPPQTVDAASASVPHAQQQQQPPQQEYTPASTAAAASPPVQQQRQQQYQQPAGFYKPSQFPPVPQTDPTPTPNPNPSPYVLGLPNVPRENPWNTIDASDRREEEEREEEEQQQKVGELIEL